MLQDSEKGKLKMNTGFYFSRNKLTELLQRDIFPSEFARIFNAVAVWCRETHAYSSLIDSLSRGESLVQVVAEGGQHKTFRGNAIFTQSRGFLKPNQCFYNLSSGFMWNFDRKTKALGLTLGTARPIGTQDLSTDLPVFPSIPGAKALCIYMDYTDPDKILIAISTEFALRLRNPQTQEQVAQTLKIIGHALADIDQENTIDFALLRENLMQDAGLLETGEMISVLRDDLNPTTSIPSLLH